MIISLMQPYLFPYLGYFQLMAASEVFVVYDDAQYMKGGWINRNRILVDHVPRWLTLPVRHAAHTLEIRAREYDGGVQERRRFMEQLSRAYAKAPNAPATLRIVESIMAFQSSNVATFNANALQVLADLLGLRAKMKWSSDISKEHANGATERVLAVCRAFDADTYLNSIGGRPLYDRTTFDSQGICLRFVEPHLAPYCNSRGEFVPALSILDVLMHNDLETVSRMVRDFRVVLP